MCVCLLLGGALQAWPNSASADEAARSAILLRVLTTSPSPRVRAQAAMALGQMPADPSTLAALRTALSDPHPVVREAVTVALTSLDAKRSEPRSTASAPKYYVQVGTPSAKTEVSSSTLREMREHLVDLVSKVDGVRLAPATEDQSAAKRVLARDALVGFSVESVVNSIERRGDSVRVNVAVVIATYPGRNIQAMLTGSASVSGRGNGGEAQRKAAEVAFASALRSLSTVLDSSRLQASATVRPKRR